MVADGVETTVGELKTKLAQKIGTTESNQHWLRLPDDPSVGGLFSNPPDKTVPRDGEQKAPREWSRSSNRDELLDQMTVSECGLADYSSVLCVIEGNAGLLLSLVLHLLFGQPIPKIERDKWDLALTAAPFTNSAFVEVTITCHPTLLNKYCRRIFLKVDCALLLSAEQPDVCKGDSGFCPVRSVVSS